MTMIQHPYCKVCGWRKGGTDSWDGTACKCGISAPAISVTVAVDRMWRDPATRLRFEAEIGLAPLEIAVDEHTQDYHSKFRAWALGQLVPSSSTERDSALSPHTEK